MSAIGAEQKLTSDIDGFGFAPGADLHAGTRVG
jgi:hypothetical protein